jgi:hypothetical protein
VPVTPEAPTTWEDPAGTAVARTVVAQPAVAQPAVAQPAVARMAAGRPNAARGAGVPRGYLRADNTQVPLELQPVSGGQLVA